MHKNTKSSWRALKGRGHPEVVLVKRLKTASKNLSFVIPAQAGTHASAADFLTISWSPASAGMTVLRMALMVMGISFMSSVSFSAPPPPPPESPATVLATGAFQLSFQLLPSQEPGIKISLTPPNPPLKKRHSPRVAVFTQRPYLWVVVTDAVVQNGAPLETLPPGYTQPEILPHADGFVMRLKIPSSATPSIDYETTGGWSLSLGVQKPPHPFGTLPFLTRKLFAFLKEPAYLAVNLKNVVPFRLKNPDNPLDFIVVPTAEPGVGFPGIFRYADFRLLKTFQGLVFDPTSPLLTVTGGDFVKLAQEGGLRLSPLEDRQRAQKIKEKARPFDFKAWQRQDLEQGKARQQLQDKIRDALPEERLRAQLTYAQFLVSYGKGEEAHSIFRLIAEYNPHLKEDAEFSSLLGVSLFLNHDWLQALRVFSNPNLTPEAELWRGATLVKLGFPLQGIPLMVSQMLALKNYPPLLKTELALIAADGCFQNADQANGATFLALAQEGPLSSAQSSALASLQEDLIILNMDPALRESYVVQVKKKGGKADPRAVAEKDFADIQSRLKDNTMTPVQAIQRLEDLRTSWRGDDLECQVLRKLAQLYALQQDYFKAMESFGRALRFFPHFPEKAAVEEEASQAFQQALASSLAPLQKIAFFNQYIGFLPTGDKKMDIVGKLAQELLDLDLPDQAVRILEKELGNQAHTRLLMPLAKAYLQDRQANKALYILDNSLLNGENDPQVEERNYLRALSCFQLKKYADALAYLEENETPEGKKLRANIFWVQKEWKKLSDELEKMMLSQKTPNPETLLQLAMAFYQEGNTESLQELREKNQHVMADSPQKELFLLLTQPVYQGEISPAKIRKILSESDDFRDLPRILHPEQRPR